MPQGDPKIINYQKNICAKSFQASSGVWTSLDRSEFPETLIPETWKSK